MQFAHQNLLKPSLEGSLPTESTSESGIAGNEESSPRAGPNFLHIRPAIAFLDSNCHIRMR